MSELDSLVGLDSEGRVYAVHATGFGDEADREFIAEILDAGDRVQRMTRDEAVRRLREYLATLPEFSGLMAEADALPAPASCPGGMECAS